MRKRVPESEPRSLENAAQILHEISQALNEQGNLSLLAYWVNVHHQGGMGLIFFYSRAGG